MHQTRGRITAVDVLRGIVMVLMPLDHTREFFRHCCINFFDPQMLWELAGWDPTAGMQTSQFRLNATEPSLH